MIPDRQLQVSLTSALAWVCWTSTVVCLTLSFVFYEWELGVLAACSTGAAATLHIRSFFCAFACQMKSAFDLGREVEREHQTSLHSVR